ncbi:MAG TPA: hypothetical protein EYN67_00915 [Flavobacteriales bacterium]|nr:hypothetical protein [Flavobacteriales bacterium]
MVSSRRVAIHFVTGRPGAGKGLYAMRLLVEELRSSNRPIITNFPLLKDKLAEYMTEEHGESFDILTRVILLEEKEDLANFYRVRKVKKDGSLHFLDVETDSKGKAVSYDIDGAQDGGVYYLLDEVHIVFGARDWQEMGRAVLFYASQHRKLGDECILISQVPKNVDSQFRSIAQSFHVLRNHGMEKFLWFKQPSMFARHTFLNMPTGARGEQPLEQSYFKLDVRQANCYETARGVGLAPKDGAQADKGEDNRGGIHIYWLLPAFLAVAVLIWWGVRASARGAVNLVVGDGDGPTMGEKLAGRMIKGTNVNNVVDKLGTNRVVVSPSRLAVTNVVDIPVKEHKALEAERDLILSYHIKPLEGGEIEFWCRDERGRRYSLADGTVAKINADYILTDDDKKLYFKQSINLRLLFRDIESGSRSAGASERAKR